LFWNKYPWPSPAPEIEPPFVIVVRAASQLDQVDTRFAAKRAGVRVVELHETALVAPMAVRTDVAATPDFGHAEGIAAIDEQGRIALAQEYVSDVQFRQVGHEAGSIATLTSERALQAGIPSKKKFSGKAGPDRLRPECEATDRDRRTETIIRS
jgi:hypothetical protein